MPEYQAWEQGEAIFMHFRELPPAFKSIWHWAVQLVQSCDNHHQLFTYLIFVIFSPQIFFGSISLHMKYIFLCGKVYNVFTDMNNFWFFLKKSPHCQIVLHRHSLWSRWQIWGLNLFHDLLPFKSILLQEFMNNWICLSREMCSLHHYCEYSSYMKGNQRGLYCFWGSRFHLKAMRSRNLNI